MRFLEAKPLSLTDAFHVSNPHRCDQQRDNCGRPRARRLRGAGAEQPAASLGHLAHSRPASGGGPECAGERDEGAAAQAAGASGTAVLVSDLDGYLRFNRWHVDVTCAGKLRTSELGIA